jgi:hypothetical protein
VVVTYTTGNGTWSFIDLAKNPAGLWAGNITSLAQNVEYFVQVLDSYGNVAQAGNRGLHYTPATISAIVGLPTDPIPVASASVSATAVFNDPNASSGHSATWNWGDGSTSQGVVIDGNLGEAGGKHTYTTPGVYTVGLSVAASGAASATAGSQTMVYQYVVVYDPKGGFVTGGGWINSPVYPTYQYMAVGGKASFGFVSKYQKGSNVPTGQTEFQFKAGNLDFHSSSYDTGSLVVAGAKALYKGSGTINDTGNYGFMVSAIDGQISGGGGTDRFRIKIWDKNKGDKVVYDNQAGATDSSDSADPVTAIGGGSITIQK